tara:strand:+ start:189346 stop:189792 length:447 start_codon:yes stop_codon:yes gene_type:complete
MLLPDYLYNWLLSLHIISVIAFMSGTMYLPRLFVYHVETKTGSEASERFKLMEKRLLKGIINPSLILTLILGILLATYPGVFNLNQIWVWIKIFSFLGILIMHGLFSMHFKKFQLDKNVKSARYFRRCNEIPFIFMMIIVFMVVIKPF